MGVVGVGVGGVNSSHMGGGAMTNAIAGGLDGNVTMNSHNVNVNVNNNNNNNTLTGRLPLDLGMGRNDL